MGKVSLRGCKGTGRVICQYSVSYSHNSRLVVDLSVQTPRDSLDDAVAQFAIALLVVCVRVSW